MLMAFNRVAVLFFAGQTSTQMPQPVQSSGATWIVYCSPSNSRSRAAHGLERRRRALERVLGSYTLMRMTPCGQTIAHLPHWMHRPRPTTGISSAMLRFSHWAVPVG